MAVHLDVFASTTNVHRASRQWESSGTTGLRNTHHNRIDHGSAVYHPPLVASVSSPTLQFVANAQKIVHEKFKRFRQFQFYNFQVRCFHQQQPTTTNQLFSSSTPLCQGTIWPSSARRSPGAATRAAPPRGHLTSPRLGKNCAGTDNHNDYGIVISW